MKARIPSEGYLVPLALGAITALGVVLRTMAIGAKGLWLDEAFSVWLAWQPLPTMLDWVIRIDQHPPLYYALLHAWIKLAGDAPDAVRIPSAIFGVAAIPVIGLLGRRLLGSTVGLLAALILALSPFHVRFAQETRMYTLLMLNASLALLALAYILSDPRRGTLAPRKIVTDPAWLGYIVCCAATLWSHNTAIFFLLAVNLFVCSLILWKRGSRVSDQKSRDTFAPPSAANWLLAQAGVVVLWGAWLVPLIAQSAGVHREFWVPYPTWRTVIGTLQAFLSAMLPVEGWPANGIWAVFGLLVAAGIWRLRERPSVLAFLLVVFLTPLIGEWMAGVWRPIFDDRTLIWTTLPLYLLLAIGVARLRRLYMMVAVAIIAIVSILSLRAYFTDFPKEEWDKAAAFVNKQVTQDDMLLFNATWVQIPFDYYFRTYNRPVIEHGAPVDLFDRGILEPKMAESDLPRLRDLISARKRVWLIYSHNWYTDPHNLIATALSQEFRQLELHRFRGLEIGLYSRP